MTVILPGILTLVLPAKPAAAQTGVTITLGANPITIRGCETQTVDVWVNNIVNAYAADVRLSFDPALLQVVDADPQKSGVQVVPGPLLKSPFLVYYTADNTLGTITFAGTQISPTLPFTGSEVLFRVQFTGKTVGTSPVNFTYSKITNRTGLAIPAAPINGTAGIEAVSNPPVLTSINPNKALVGSPQFTLTANGSNFLSTTIVRWNGSDLATFFVNNTTLQAAIPSTYITAVGTANVTAYSPGLCGGTSASQSFLINDTTPTITQLDPAQATAEGNEFTLSVIGKNFVPDSVVKWGAVPLVTTFIDETHLTAVVPAAQIASAGYIDVIVSNPAPEGGDSKPTQFTINNPAPQITNLAPSSTLAGGNAFTLDLYGDHFVPTSQVEWGTVKPATTYINNQHIQAAISSNLIAVPGTVAVKVNNPAPGGGPSNALIFSILNVAPLANDQTVTTPEDTPVTITLAASDANHDNLTFQITSSPDHGTLTGSGAVRTFTPSDNYFGADSLQFLANDGSLNSNIATVNITISPVNDPPVANNDTYTFTEDIPLIVDAPGVLINDSDMEGSTLSAVLVQAPAHGILILNADGSFTYAPAENSTASETFTYHADDGALESKLATVTLNITAVNDPPQLQPVPDKTTDENVLLSFGVVASDPDGDSLTYSLDKGAPAGASINPSNGIFSWTPTEAQGPGTYDFTVRITDGVLTASDMFQITVNEVNSAPVIDPIADKTVAEGSLLQFTVIAHDSDIPANTLLFALGAGAPTGAAIDPASGVFTWMPSEVQGPGTYDITVHVSDGALSASVTFQVTVNEVNLAPAASTDTYQVEQDKTLNIPAPGVLANDSDPENNPLTSQWVSGPDHGSLTLNPDGSFVYTPIKGYVGSDKFSYQASDGISLSAVTAVTINVIPGIPVTGQNKIFIPLQTLHSNTTSR